MTSHAYRSAVVALAGQSDTDVLGWIAPQVNILPRSRYGHPALRGVHLLQSTALLACPPTWKEYRGHVGVQQTPTGLRYIAFTTFGAVDGHQHGAVYAGEDLDAALAHVNKIIRAKLRKGYVPESTGETTLTRDTVMETLARTVSA